MKDCLSNAAANAAAAVLNKFPSQEFIKEQLESWAAKSGVPVVVTPSLDSDEWTIEAGSDFSGIILSITLSNDRIKDLVRIAVMAMLDGPEKAKTELQNFLVSAFMSH